jgi:hypothetical protein
VEIGPFDAWNPCLASQLSSPATGRSYLIAVYRDEYLLVSGHPISPANDGHYITCWLGRHGP